MRRKVSITYVFIILLIIFILFSDFLFTSTSPLPPNNKMLVHYINVGQGDSALIQVNNKNLLIDAGPKDGKKLLFDYLDSLGISKFDYIIATHPHEDHIGNMSAIINKYDIEYFFAPKVEHTTSDFEKMVESLVNKNKKINIIKEGTSNIDLGKNTNISVFSPNNAEYDNLNNYSPIIKIEYGNNSFLFTGDAEKDVEEEVLSKKFPIKSDVLKVGHHGSSTSTSKSFLTSVNPSIAIISVGLNNKYDHPNDKTIDLLNSNDIKIYRTDIDKVIVLSSDGTKISKITKK